MANFPMQWPSAWCRRQNSRSSVGKTVRRGVVDMVWRQRHKKTGAKDPLLRCGTPDQILTGGLPLRRRSLYTTELRGRMTRNILPFWRWICQCLICWERGGEKRLYSPPPSVIMGRKSGSDRRRRTGPVRNIEKRTVNLWTERRSSRAARCPRSSPGI